MQQTSIDFDPRANFSALLSLTHPSKDLFQRHQTLLRRAVPAGFSAPANDSIQPCLDFDEHAIQYRDSIFFMRVSGNSMSGAGIFDGDLLVVDRCMPATSGSMVIAVVDGELTIKQLLLTPAGRILKAAHPSYPDVLIKAEQELSIWGVVQWNVHKD